MLSRRHLLVGQHQGAHLAVRGRAGRPLERLGHGARIGVGELAASGRVGVAADADRTAPTGPARRPAPRARRCARPSAAASGERPGRATGGSPTSRPGSTRAHAIATASPPPRNAHRAVMPPSTSTPGPAAAQSNSAPRQQGCEKPFAILHAKGESYDLARQGNGIQANVALSAGRRGRELSRTADRRAPRTLPVPAGDLGHRRSSPPFARRESRVQ